MGIDKEVFTEVGKRINTIVIITNIAMSFFVLFGKLHFFNILMIVLALTPLGWFGLPIVFWIKHGIWYPTIVTYGGFLLAIIFFRLGYVKEE